MIVVYHNPDCGTSRNALALIRASGEEPEVVEYLRDPPSRERLAELIASAGLTVREALRQKGTPYDELLQGRQVSPVDLAVGRRGLEFCGIRFLADKGESPERRPERSRRIYEWGWPPGDARSAPGGGARWEVPGR